MEKEVKETQEKHRNKTKNKKKTFGSKVKTFWNTPVPIPKDLLSGVGGVYSRGAKELGRQMFWKHPVVGVPTTAAAAAYGYGLATGQIGKKKGK